MLKGRVTLLALLVVGSGCATLDPNYEEPTVTLASIRPLPAEGAVPSFEIDLRIINPNANDLRLDGIVYTLALQGREVVKGVGRDFPVIEGYTEETVTLVASPNVLAGIRLLGDLAAGRGNPQGLDYALSAKLDLAGPFSTIRLTESGTLGEFSSDP